MREYDRRERLILSASKSGALGARPRDPATQPKWLRTATRRYRPSPREIRSLWFWVGIYLVEKGAVLETTRRSGVRREKFHSFAPLTVESGRTRAIVDEPCYIPTKAMVISHIHPRDCCGSCAPSSPLEFRASGGSVVTETIVRQLIFTLSVAREIASRESPDYDLVLLLIQQALQVAKDEASRHGIMIDFDDVSEREH